MNWIRIKHTVLICSSGNRSSLGASMLVIGIIIGSFISALLSGDFQLQWVPSLWAGAFGSSVLPRIFVALLGGICIGFGARWADGCTSGLIGILIGSGLFAAIYPKIKDGVLKAGYYGDITLPRLLKAKDWVVVIPVGIVILLLLFWLERGGGA